MPKFTDTTSIRIKAGNGGAGSVSFHREKFIAKGGPDGGDGGRGGDVYLKADSMLHNLSHLFKDRQYRAENGTAGMSNNRHGKDGDDLTIRVPAGTQVLDPDSDVVLADLIEDGALFLAASGGIGGKGNAFFKSSTFQTPRFSQPGMPGEEKRLILNLKLIADIGLVGLPNAGKSTLLSKITNARPKIADYPFTTLIPNLGVFQNNGGTIYKIADIPGIIEGAHRGLGLGLSFLQHIERVKAILFILDITGDDLPYTLTLLKSELNTYNPELTGKPYYVLLNKIDLVDDDTVREKTRTLDEQNLLAISAATGEHMNRLIAILDKLMENDRAS
ncbi:MAG TPA: GTPase ObgE [Spirochaetota bacterium]|nr:GTPase ObgE [Spirochaetota bacterium]HPG51565.1 GTPase ObgE [Spirochaetota bacterium]